MYFHCALQHATHIYISVLDSFRQYIVGLIEVVGHLFNELGIQAVPRIPTGCTSVLFGQCPWESPPQVAFDLLDTTIPNSILLCQPSEGGIKEATRDH